MTENKGIRVEYFDDRWYKVTYPAKERKKFTDVPDNLIYERGDEFDIYFPSVTTIKSYVEPNKFLSKWRGDVGNREADIRISEALEKGSIIHDCCQKLCEGWDVVYQNPHTKFPTDEIIKQLENENKAGVYVTHSQEIQVQVARFERLLDVLQPKIHEIERHVFFAGEMYYAGTVDYVWEIAEGEYSISKKAPEKIEGGTYVVDLKTGKSCSEEYFTQLAPYVQAWAKQKNKVDGGLLIHLNSENKMGIYGVKIFKKDLQELKPYYEKFTNYYKIYMADNPYTPSIFEIPAIIKGRITANADDNN